MLKPAIAPNSSPLNSLLSFRSYNNSLYFNANYNNLGDVLWRVTDAPSAAPYIATEKTILAYPNPAQSELYLQTEHPATISITDLYGRVVFSQSVVGTTTIDTQGWAAGLYHLSSNINHKPVSLVIGGQ
ncbi:MAG: T9SS type A sorting domain-containing protein [Bacteroidetes bacterium]|nr:T9SS type A sorting domain-containing protein [Bacteroidota bacterium]